MENALRTDPSQTQPDSHAGHPGKLTVCPNCDTPLPHQENYCPNCGQQNHELKLPLGHLIYEVVENITHFDDKLWRTLKAIFTRPGQITADFLAGKRVRYVPPVRLYVFVSVIFFFLVGKFADDQVEKGLESVEEITSDTARTGIAMDLEAFVHNDSLLKARRLRAIAGQIKLMSPLNEAGMARAASRLKQTTFAQRDSLLRKNRISITPASRRQLDELIALVPDQPKITTRVNVGFGSVAFGSEAERRTYQERVPRMSDAQLDSLIRAEGDKPGWFTRKFHRQVAKFANFKEGNYAHEFMHVVTKNLSFVMFVLMPFVAVLLLLFYFRRGRYYYEHLIFSVHIHTVLFMLFSLALLTTYFFDPQTTSNVLGVTVLAGWLYFLLSLKRVYAQNWFKTTVKFLLLSLTYFFTAVLFLVGAVFAGMLTF